MIGRRKTGMDLGMSRLYAYKGKRVTTYYTITPDNRRINLGHDLRAAKRKLLEMDGEAPAGGQITEHLDEMMRERARMVASGKLAVATYKGNEAEVEELKKAFGKMAPEAVKPMHVWKYLHTFRGAKAPIRANREIALFSRMFSRLVNQGAIETNPCVGVERNEESARERLVTDAEFDAFLAFLRGGGEARERIAVAAELAYLTAKAQGQILRLSRTKLLPDGILFGKRKRGASTFVEWTPRLRRAVEAALAMPAKITSTFVIFNAAGQPYTSSGFRALWQRAMNDWIKAGNERFTFHDLRAKATTDLAQDGRKASDLTGHKSEQTVEKVYDRRRVRKAPAVR